MNEQDKELLELAAKACGVAQLVWSGCGNTAIDPFKRNLFWNPLADDGDALRLACALKIGIDHSKFVVHAMDDRGNDLAAESVASAIPRDRAARRAIVRAAAEIGKAMP